MAVGYEGHKVGRGEATVHTPFRADVHKAYLTLGDVTHQCLFRDGQAGGRFVSGHQTLIVERDQH